MSPPRIADAHCDLLLELALRSGRRGEPDAFGTHWLPHLRSGGVALQVCALFADLPSLPELALREVLGQVAAFERTLRERPADVVALRSRADLAAWEAGEAGGPGPAGGPSPAGGPIGLLLLLEGAEALGYDASLLDVLWRLGVRMLGLTWNRRNPFADGVAERTDGGLSEIGRTLVDRCVELGIVLDLAHASPRTFREIVERADGAPVFCSHAGCRSVFDHPRNLDDDQLRALADADGVLGIMMHPIGVDPARATIDRVVEHVEHAVEIMGIDRVCFGCDFGRQIVRATGIVLPADAMVAGALPSDCAVEGLEGPQDFPALVAALRARGFDDDRLDAVLADNLVRFLRRALPD
jgi:membrane dipeptidase